MQEEILEKDSEEEDIEVTETKSETNVCDSSPGSSIEKEEIEEKKEVISKYL